MLPRQACDRAGRSGVARAARALADPESPGPESPGSAQTLKETVLCITRSLPSDCARRAQAAADALGTELRTLTGRFASKLLRQGQQDRVGAWSRPQ